MFPPSSSQALTRPTRGLLVGGRYRLDAGLGEGGVGSVWAATHTITLRRYALKFLKSATAGSDLVRKRFWREARAASFVQHPNVIEVHDLFELEDRTPVLVMDLLEGQTLAARLRESVDHRLSLAEAASHLLPVISAVGTAHALGVVHRDLKPDNLFLSTSGGTTTVLVLDFGLAKLTSSDHGSRRTATITQLGSILGTPSYMSPEQALGDASVDYRTDIWALGVVLFEALTGVRPIEGESVGEILLRLKGDAVVPIQVVLPQLPAEIARAVDAMLSWAPQNRPPLHEVIAALEPHTAVRAPAFGPPDSGRASRELSPGHINGKVDASAAATRPMTPLALSETVWCQGAHPRPSASGSNLVPLPEGTALADGRMLISRRIGEGGSGVVYAAFDQERRTQVALKTLTSLDASSLYRLKKEFRTLADVVHPNVVRLHELFVDRELWFFTMELVEGVAFDHWVRPKGALNQEHLRSALRQLVLAVSAIHAACTLHRDLKPSNVLVTERGHVSVLDFGLAVDPRVGGVAQSIADAGICGTPAYMAPEQAAGEMATEASDYYAVGVMLFEGLTGRLPFCGRAGAILAAKQCEVAPRARRLQPDVPRDLDALCARLLERNPESRPTLQELCAALGMADSPTPDVLRARSSFPPQSAVDLVGRNAELGLLRRAHSAAQLGDKPVVLLLSGESGIGKTALLDRFLSELQAQGQSVVLAGRCYERESVPFKGFDEVVDELCRHLRTLNSVDTAALMPREVYALRRLFPILARVDAIATAPERHAADPFELRRRGFLALGELLGRIRDRQPLVVAIDDLQWSDRDSTTLLLHLLRQADAPRLCLIASHRSERMEESPMLKPLYDTLPLDIRLDVRKLRLGPLPLDEASELVRDRPIDVAHALVREAGGNPLLLRELARAGQARGRSLAEILRARVASLPDAQRRLLEAIAVAARPLSLELAAEAAGEPAEARAAFDALRSAQLARSAVSPRSVECYHDRVRESVVGALSEDAVRGYHEALGSALAKTPDADPEHLCEHYEQAQKPTLAAGYAVQAADRAMRGFAFDQAARLYDKALRLGSFSADEVHRLRVVLGDALAHGGRGPEAAAAYALACDGTDAKASLKLNLKAARQYLSSGRLVRGRELLSQALSAFGMRLPGSPASAMAMLAIERGRLRLNELRPAPRRAPRRMHPQLDELHGVVSGLSGLDALSSAALNAQVLRLAQRAGDRRAVVQALHLEIWSRTIGIGNPDRVPELLQKAHGLIAELQDPFLEAWQRFYVGCYEYLARPEGDLERALATIEQFLAQVHAEPLLFAGDERALGQFHRVCLLTWLARGSDLARELPALLDEAWQRNDLFLIPVLIGAPFVIWLGAGARAEAQRELERAFQAWSSLDNPYVYHDFLLHLARVVLCHHDGDVRGAWMCSSAHEARFRGSFASKSSLIAGLEYFLRGAAAAALAGKTPDASERETLLREAERTPLLLRGNSLVRPWLLLPRAAAACVRRDRDRAIRLLQEIDVGRRPANFGPLHAYAVRRRLGALMGGDSGRELVAAADVFFHARGAVDPEHLVSTLIPGCAID
jgi:eukaryotic-like serine/threonine-protein kinase